MKVAVIVPFLLLWIVFVADAQKLRYKTVFPLLEAKNYEEGEPMLRLFLSDKKNLEEVNASLQMGYIHEMYALKAKVVADSTWLYQNADSAILFFKSTLAMLDDKELKRNNDYYKEYYRRDLRTGEFGIKLSDIQLELETKIKNLEKRVANAKIINTQVRKTDELYKQSISIFKKITDRFPTYNAFLLSCEESQMEALNNLIDNGFEIKSAHEKITQSIIILDNAGFTALATKKDITDITQDGRQGSNVYAGEFDFWDFQAWARKASRTVSDEVWPLQRQLFETQRGMVSYLEKVKIGMEVDAAAMAKALGLADLTKLKTYEPNSVAWNYMQLQSAQIRYYYLTNAAYEIALIDSSAVSFHLQRADTLAQILTSMEGALTKLTDEAIEASQRVYPDLFKTLGGAQGLKSEVAKANEWRTVRIARATNAKAYWEEKARWAVFQNERIDLSFTDSSVVKKDILGKSVPLVATTDAQFNIYMVGLMVDNATVRGFVAATNDGREGLWKKPIDLYTKKIAVDTISLLSKFTESNEGSYTAYLYDPSMKKDKNFTIMNFNVEGNINWNNSLLLENAPVDVKYNTVLGETVVFLVEESRLATLPAGQKGYIVIDRNGSIR